MTRGEFAAVDVVEFAEAGFAAAEFAEAGFAAAEFAEAGVAVADVAGFVWFFVFLVFSSSMLSADKTQLLSALFICIIESVSNASMLITGIGTNFFTSLI